MAQYEEKVKNAGFYETMGRGVWDLIKVLAGMQSVAPKLEDIVDCITLIAHKNSINSIVARLVLDASAYFIWQEHNNRLHGKEIRRLHQICDIIVEVVRMKLMTIRFKKLLNVTCVLQIWKILNGDINVLT
ncbi:hypothetical protein Tco_0373712 [Tanacetum coccineum]